MNRIELKKIEGISPRAYSLYGPLGDEYRYVLEERFDTWFVYYTERGDKINEQIFNNEGEVCRYLLIKLQKSPMAKIIK